MKTNELEGAQLDYWVARAEGWNFFWSKHNVWLVMQPGEKQSAAFCSDWTPFDSETGRPNKRPAAWRVMEEANFYPSTDWAQGGPIIEREGIAIVRGEELGPRGRHISYSWRAFHDSDVNHDGAPYGIDSGWKNTTPLLAAMRAYVASKFGDEVPDEETP